MILLKLFSRLPMWLLYTLSDLMFVTIYYLAGYRKRVVANNIRNSFPKMSEQEVKSAVKEFYRRFMDFVMETLKAFTITGEELTARVKFTNVQDVQSYADKQQSILVIASHQFNWEWALLTGCIVLPFPVDAVYQKLSNKGFNDLMLKTRSRFGGQPIEKSNILRAVLKNPDRLRALGIVADQSPRRKSPKYWTNFLSQDTAFFLGPEQIAKLAKYPTFFFKVNRVKRGYYTVELVKLTEPPYEKDNHAILEAYAKATEELVKEDPAGYLWSHKRWKLKRESS
ncbi:lysophospholipid acyltransferase family protein [Fulvivirga sp. 29W222]|uniref:Lysophospholipid acyltransferase family protein n=1 Tax=Fulvivirga marina TaxID=2494733 RepID=A0A937KE41_9BACT|nr:lysophospholipid acyltransferase family protein [Fulvivirga marina]MBL6449746.1 lysophospholipid acyltransferase family protein [Fulvivirga marina]